MRFILGFIGAVFALILTISLISGLSTYFSSPPAPLASDVFHKEPKELHLASDGPFGKFDNEQLQRGLQVYTEVCSACHSLKLVAFHDLKEIGYSDAEIKAYAGSASSGKSRLRASTRTPVSRQPASRCRPTPSRLRSRTKLRRVRPTTTRFRPICR